MTTEEHVAKAAEILKAMTPSQRTGIKFGMFPSGLIPLAERKGYDGHSLINCLMKLDAKCSNSK